jgi:head-tail adaptor
VARGNPAAEGIVRDAFAAHDIQRMLASDVEKQLTPLYAGVQNNPASIARIHRALDGQPIPLSPAETQTAIGLRKLFDDMADMAGLPHEQRLADYFPHLREEVSSLLKVQIRTGGAKGAVAREIPQEYKVFFQKPRTVPGVEGVEFGLPAVQRYVQAMAKRVSLKGGTLPDGSKVEGMLHRIGPKFSQLPEVNEYRAYFRDYVKDLVGGQPKDQLLSPQMASTIKKVEFLRTIGYNVTSPIHNLTQTLNTFAKTDPRSWSAAWYDIFKNKTVMNLARRHLDLQISKADIEILANPNKLDRFLDTVISGKGRAGWMFQKAEELNRLHAFAAGYRDAVRMGLKGDGIIQHAKRIVDETQFRFGPENAPGLLRQSGGGKLTEIAGVVGQFKKFQMNQVVFLKNLVTHDPAGLAKWLVGTVAIGGTELPGIKTVKDTVTEALGGDPNDIKFRGLLGESGIYLGNQIGIGALPFESIRDLAFAFPGPALSHMLEVASVMSNKALAVTDLATGRFGDELAPDDWASRLVRLGSVQANRIRQAIVSARSEGPNIGVPRNQSEAFGLAAPTGRGTRPKSALKPGGVLGQALGIRSPETQEYSDLQQDTAEKVERWNQLNQWYNEARAARDQDAMGALREQAQSEFGRTLRGSKEGTKGARQRQRTHGLERQIKNAPKQLRRDLKKEVPEKWR